MPVTPLSKRIHRNNENAQGRARRALEGLEGAGSERENKGKRGTLFYSVSEWFVSYRYRFTEF